MDGSDRIPQVLSALAETNVAASVRRLMVYRAVEMAMGATTPPRSSTQTLTRHEVLLSKISEVAGESLNGNEAIAWLAQRGAGLLANRVPNAVRGRNTVARLDGSLLPDVCQFLRMVQEELPQSLPPWRPEGIMDDRVLHRGHRARSPPAGVTGLLGDGSGDVDRCASLERRTDTCLDMQIHLSQALRK